MVNIESFIKKMQFSLLMELNIAIFGDLHGSDDVVFRELPKWEEENKKRIDAVAFVGDLDSIVRKYESRREAEFDSLVADYHYGKKKAKYPIFFIAGNEDSWAVLRDFKEGGFIAENVYFLGRAGIKDFKGIRIGGLSGSYLEREYYKPLPDQLDLWWAYYRHNEVEWLKKQEIDLLLLHPWIEPYTDIPYKIEVQGTGETTKRQTRCNHLYEIVEATHPKIVFMGHKHECYIEATTGVTKIFGLKRVKNDFSINSKDCFKVISIDKEGYRVL